MKFRRSICTAVLLAVLLTLLVPTSVFALEDNSSTLPPYKNDLLYERTFDEGLCYPWHTCETAEENAPLMWSMFRGSPVIKHLPLLFLTKAKQMERSDETPWSYS